MADKGSNDSALSTKKGKDGPLDRNVLQNELRIHSQVTAGLARPLDSASAINLYNVY
jgi:hypothetical protein